jgi:hypothetical protein
LKRAWNRLIRARDEGRTTKHGFVVRFLSGFRSKSDVKTQPT